LRNTCRSSPPTPGAGQQFSAPCRSHTVRSPFSPATLVFASTLEQLPPPARALSLQTPSFAETYAAHCRSDCLRLYGESTSTCSLTFFRPVCALRSGQSGVQEGGGIGTTDRLIFATANASARRPSRPLGLPSVGDLDERLTELLSQRAAPWPIQYTRLIQKAAT